MTSPTVALPTIEMARKAFIIAAIGVKFDFKNSAVEYHADYFLNHFNGMGIPVTSDEIKLSLLEKSLRKAIFAYDILYFALRTAINRLLTKTGWRLKRSDGGICHHC